MSDRIEQQTEDKPEEELRDLDVEEDQSSDVKGGAHEGEIEIGS